VDLCDKASLQTQADVLLGRWAFGKEPKDKSLFRTAKEEVAWTICREKSLERAALLVELMASRMGPHDLSELAEELAAQIPSLPASISARATGALTADLAMVAADSTSNRGARASNS
jgi:hypothetical protein